MLGARWFFLCWLILALRVSAQPLPDRRELSGRVTSTKNVPVFGAQIQIKRKESTANAVFWGTTVLSDVAGEFRVPDAEDGDYIVSVYAPGYDAWSAPYTLKEYEPPLRVALQRKVSLTFTILNPEGQPVRGKSAAIFGFVTKPGTWQRTNQPGISLGTTPLTTSEGHCVLPHSNQGIYHELYVAVRGVGYARWQGKIEMLEGASHHFEIQLQKAGASLTLKVVSEAPATQKTGLPVALPTGLAIGAAQIYLQTVQPLQESEKALAQWLFRQNELLSDDGTGTLQLRDLLPGRYQIRVTPPLNCNLAKFAESVQSLDLGAEENKEIVFPVPACSAGTPPLPITLHDEQGMPLANRHVRFICQPLSEATGLNLSFQEASERHVPFSAVRRGTTDAQGKLTLYPFWVGTWRVSAYELGARLPFRGVGTVKVTPEGGQMTIATALTAELPE